ncbi:MAG: porin family protein [Sulfurovum sp.]|nr:porin family protein [Sulfurovum sp.]
MKKFTLSVAAVMAMSTFAIAGGDIAPVEPVVETPVVEAAPGNFYVGLGYSFVELNNMWDDGSLYDENYEQDALTFIAGYNFNEYIGVEGRYMMAAGDADYHDRLGNEDDSSFDNNFKNIAVYLKPMLPINDFTLYGLVGFGKTTYNYDALPDITANGLQYGAGVSYALYEKLSLFVDYTVLAEDDDIQIVSGDDVWDVDGDAWTFGLTYKF